MKLFQQLLVSLPPGFWPPAPMRRAEHCGVSIAASLVGLDSPPTSTPPTGLTGLAGLVETYGCVAGYFAAPSLTVHATAAAC